MNVREDIEKGLVEILENQIECNSRLFELMRKEREVVVQNRVEELEGINQEKTVIAKAVAQLEDERSSLMPYFVDKYKLSSREAKLEELIKAVEEPFASVYKSKQEELRKVLYHMRIAQNANKKLLEKALKFHEKSVNLLYRMTSQQVGYSSQGQLTHTNNRLIDSIG